MSKKVLPIGKPPIIGYLHHAYALAVLMPHEECIPWFYSNYINMLYYTRFENETDYSFDFYMNQDVSMGIPWVKYATLHREIVNKTCSNIVEYIIKMIDLGYYIYASVDEYYIPNRWAYGNTHQGHGILVFGYDMEQKTLDVLGFTENSMFGETKASFEQFETAFKAIDTNIPFTMLRKRNSTEEMVPIEFDLKRVYTLIEDYLECRNSYPDISTYCAPLSEFFGFDMSELNKFDYGINAYDGLVKYYSYLLDNKAVFDIRPIHIFWEHKKCMLMRIKYMYDNKYIEKLDPVYREYEKIEQEMLALRDLNIRYAITLDKKIPEECIKSLSSLKLTDKDIMKALLSEIQIKV